MIDPKRKTAPPSGDAIGRICIVMRANFGKLSSLMIALPRCFVAPRWAARPPYKCSSQFYLPTKGNIGRRPVRAQSGVPECLLSRRCWGLGGRKLGGSRCFYEDTP
jgi:hypothetical protein